MAGNGPFQQKTITTKQKNIHNSIKTYDILIKEKVLESFYDLLLSFLKKKCLFWVWPVITFFLHKLSPKIALFRGFSKKIFRTTGLQLKLLILIESPNIFHWKPAKKSNWVWSWGKIWAKLGPML